MRTGIRIGMERLGRDIVVTCTIIIRYFPKTKSITNRLEILLDIGAYNQYVPTVPILPLHG